MKSTAMKREKVSDDAFPHFLLYFAMDKHPQFCSQLGILQKLQTCYITVFLDVNGMQY